MWAAIVVVHVVQRNHVAVIVYFLAVRIREPRESPHLHSHGQILSLDE